MHNYIPVVFNSCALSQLSTSCTAAADIVLDVQMMRASSRLMQGSTFGRWTPWNSTFCPHSVFMCFVWISEQTAIISYYYSWIALPLKMTSICSETSVTNYHPTQHNMHCAQRPAQLQCAVFDASPAPDNRTRTSRLTNRE
jgi:hypothetical protein